MHAEIMEILGGAFEGLGRDMAASDLEEYSPEELVAELRTIEQLVEGFCVSVEDIGPVALLTMSDTRERIQRALEIARVAARA